MDYYSSEELFQSENPQIYNCLKDSSYRFFDSHLIFLKDGCWCLAKILCDNTVYFTRYDLDDDLKLNTFRAQLDLRDKLKETGIIYTEGYLNNKSYFDEVREKLEKQKESLKKRDNIFVRL